MATSALGRLRRQSFVVPLADTTQQIFQLRSDFGSANANCDAVVDAADDTDAICAPGPVQSRRRRELWHRFNSM